MAELTSLDAKELAEKVTVTVKITRLRQFGFRAWLTDRLVRLAAIVSWVDLDIVEEHPLESTIEWFGEQGLVISIAYGPMKGKGNHWSVDLLDDETGEAFNRPYQANSLSHCIEIAKIEAEKRGWIE